MKAVYPISLNRKKIFFFSQWILKDFVSLLLIWQMQFRKTENIKTKKKQLGKDLTQAMV